MTIRAVVLAGSVALGALVCGSAGANPTAYDVAPMLQQRDSFADRFWGLPQAPAVVAPAAAGGGQLYDFNALLGRPDPFATTFYGQTPVSPLAIAPSVAVAPVAAARAPAPRPATTASGLPAQAPVPVQIVTAQPLPAAAPLQRIALTAAAAPPSRWYVSGNIGMATLSEATNTGAGIANEHAYDAGPALTVGLGNTRSNTLALEGEFGLHRFGMSTITPSGGAPATATGTVSTMSLMANATWSPDYFGWRFNPYLLGGAGIARHQMQDVVAAGVPPVSSSAWVIAYQLGFGTEYPVTSHWSLDASYRYFATLAPEFKDANGGTFETAVASHNLLLGARYHF